MEQKNKKRGLERWIVLKAFDWRDLDIAALGDKRDPGKQQAEYKARRELAKTIDDARES